ncbi:MAG: hypothetical protein QOD02_2720 [Mycobacterium sp.]|nr:hypothetical protein [Mycobacterium sp.]
MLCNRYLENLRLIERYCPRLVGRRGMTDTNRAAEPVGWSLLETYPRVSSGPLAELRPEDVVDVYPDTADVALVDLDLMQMRCGMGAASRRAPVVLPEVGAQAVLQRPLDCFELP